MSYEMLSDHGDWSGPRNLLDVENFPNYQCESLHVIPEPGKEWVFAMRHLVNVYSSLGSLALEFPSHLVRIYCALPDDLFRGQVCSQHSPTLRSPDSSTNASPGEAEIKRIVVVSI